MSLRGPQPGCSSRYLRISASQGIADLPIVTGDRHHCVLAALVLSTIGFLDDLQRDTSLARSVASVLKEAGDDLVADRADPYAPPPLNKLHRHTRCAVSFTGVSRQNPIESSKRA
jgi:hypothetical protein